jgi:hypothetical protein
MRARKSSKLKAIGVCILIGMGIFMVYIIIPRDLEIAIFPSDHNFSNVTIMVNDEIVFSQIYNRSADTVVGGKDFEVIHVRIYSSTFSIQLDDHATGAMSRFSTYTFYGIFFTCRMLDDGNVEMDQHFFRPDYT